MSPALQVDSLPAEPSRSPPKYSKIIIINNYTLNNYVNHFKSFHFYFFNYYFYLFIFTLQYCIVNLASDVDYPRVSDGKEFASSGGPGFYP